MSRLTKSIAYTLTVTCGLPAFAQTFNQPVEPNAGKWKTWVISSGKDFRVPPPPDSATTQAELAFIRDIGVTTQDQNLVNSVVFWSAGAPSYRWIDLINNRSTRGASVSTYAARLYVYVAQAMYDATVAA